MTLKRLIPFIFSLMIALAALTQTSSPPKTPKPDQTQTTPPKTDKAEPDRKAKAAMPTAPQDLDRFFKEGERQAKENPSCRKKPEPVA